MQYCQGAWLASLPAGLGFPPFRSFLPPQVSSPESEFDLQPQYRAPRALDAVLKKVQPGLDAFITENYEAQVAAILGAWSSELLVSPQKTGALEEATASNFSAASPEPIASEIVNDRSIIQVSRLKFTQESSLDRQTFLEELRYSLSSFSRLLTAEFQVTSIRPVPPRSSSQPCTSLETRVRFELVGTGESFHREQRIGDWQLMWDVLPLGHIRLRTWQTLGETRSRSLAPIFSDIAPHAFAGVSSLSSQLAHGSDYWRTLLDAACGIDIYGHNGVSLADIDGDGFDDLYVCQPAGLPNRLYRNRGDGTFEDITEFSGLGILENTACALFADVDNDGRQDAIIVRSTEGPLLFLSDGGGKFRPKLGAFQFADTPRGSFTGAAIADYDRDGWLDIYFCLYSFYQGADQYRYPAPFFDAENGPPNIMMRNQRDATFRDVTRESGLDRNNTRFSFCCGWGDFDGDNWPDLYVANDFGRKNLYRNNGDGTFTDIAPEVGVEDSGAGMSVCWLDYDNDGKQDLYIADMWTAAGLRVSEQEIFQPNASEETRALFRKHAMGNSLFANHGDSHFDDASDRSGTRVGRWSWSSDALDFDHDGFPDLYIANGMISGTAREDLNSFFWRQVVANSPQTPKPSEAYEQGWNAIDELIHADGTWSGYERNILYMNNRDGTFSDVSGVTGLDFVEDARTFALADFDHDGRVEIFLKNRNAPQLRLLKNVAPTLGPAIAFRLTGKKSSRDAIGAAVTVETKSGRQTLFLQAGSGFLAQHSKELFFGLGDANAPVRVSIRWPSGIVQNLSGLPLNHRIWIEEGSVPRRIEPFKKLAPQPADTKEAAAAAPEADSLPVLAETWLLSPLAAPNFSLPDLAGRLQSLSSRRGNAVLLHFWTAASANSLTDLAELDRSSARWVGEGLELLTINADQPSVRGGETTTYQKFSFPILRASADVIALYNILYRFIFDRHRDLSLPASFLVDEEGAIVKIYQGPVSRHGIEDDFRHIPRTAAERLAKALPFPGVIGSADFTRNYLTLGSVFFERGYPDQSESFFELACRDDPSAEAYYGLGSVYLQQQKNAQARASFERVVKMQANYPGTLPRTWNNLGIVAAREGHGDEAMQNFQRALQIDPDFVIALVNLGTVYHHQKRWDDAKRVLGRAVELSPDDAVANYRLGMFFAQTNDTDRAFDHLQKALATRPAYPEALNNLGVLLLRTNRQEDAEKSFKESIRVAPAYDKAYLNLARLYKLEDKTREARAVLIDLLKQHPGHSQAEKELEDLPQ